jgi:hypothetical protein
MSEHNLKGENRDMILHDLAASFVDVSFYANQMVPIAAPIPAEACAIGREIIQKQGWFKEEDVKAMRKKYGKDWNPKNRFSQYNGADDLPWRLDRQVQDGKLAKPDFWLSWSPGLPTGINNNDGLCTRYWAGRANLRAKGTDERYCDERIDKCDNSFRSAILTQLTKLLWDLALRLEMTFFESEDAEVDQCDLRLAANMEMFEQASEWFRCLAWLPYDATFRLEALLDCLVFFMGHQYGKYQLDCCSHIELLQLGFGFTNLVGRKQWVLAVETMLHNFNMQCKFMMPCKHAPPPLQFLNWFSLKRGLPEGMVPP